jgi:hypothetical protein
VDSDWSVQQHDRVCSCLSVGSSASRRVVSTGRRERQQFKAQWQPFVNRLPGSMSTSLAVSEISVSVISGNQKFRLGAAVWQITWAHYPLPNP